MTPRPSRLKSRKTWLGTGVVLVLLALNAPAVIGFAEEEYHQYAINRPAYKAARGHWALAAMPKKYQLNSIHAVLLHTGKVLLVAGSGNDVKHFHGGRFRSTLWDPVKNTFRKIDTPDDMFCAGQIQLPDGKILLAGGTGRYETLKGDVKRAGGPMLVKNEDPDRAKVLPKGTVFRSPSGREYRTQVAVRVPPATKKVSGRTGAVTVTASESRVYVEAAGEGRRGVTNTTEQYAVGGLKGTASRNVYGIANKLGLDKKDFQGIRDAYEFDPVTEKYERVVSMREARWYPTLTTLTDGRVLAVSGLDDIGQVVPGKNEIYDPRTKTWSAAPTRFFPTYPSFFLTGRDTIFYTGSNAGYGPADVGRTPGLWNLDTNAFTPVKGLSHSDIMETSSSVLLPPAQDRRVMVLGGGGVGESTKATARTAIIDLKESRPVFRDGPSLPVRTRYLNSVIMPDDTVFTTGGSRDYRGRGASNILGAQFYDPARNRFTTAAAPTVGRNYHSEALLLPDGRVAVFGSDPLFSDKANTRLGRFEQRVEVYSPPYLYHGHRPRLALDGGQRVRRGGRLVLRSPDAGSVATMRLIRPGSATHVTDFDQRSIALRVQRGPGRLTASVPEDRSLVPSGWYMLFATDKKGTPSKAVWVHVV